jgi:hypothetical protein
MTGYALEDAQRHDCRELPIADLNGYAVAGYAVACPGPPGEPEGANGFPNVLVFEREAPLGSAVRFIRPYKLHRGVWKAAPKAFANASGQDLPGMAARGGVGNRTQDLKLKVGAADRVTHIRVYITC